MYSSATPTPTDFLAEAKRNVIRCPGSAEGVENNSVFGASRQDWDLAEILRVGCKVSGRF